MAGQRGSGMGGAYLLKVDQEGSPLWERVLHEDGVLLDLASSVREEDGGYILAGSAFLHSSDGSCSGGMEGYLLRTDAKGNVLWRRGFRGHGLSRLFSAAQTSDGGASLVKLAPEGGYSQPILRRGDVLGDGVIDLSDVVFTLNYLFGAGPEPGCLDSSDSDDDGSVTITDGIEVLEFLFLRGHHPSAPGPYLCGPDPTPDELSCRSLGSCAGGPR